MSTPDPDLPVSRILSVVLSRSFLLDDIAKFSRNQRLSLFLKFCSNVSQTFVKWFFIGWYVETSCYSNVCADLQMFLKSLSNVSQLFLKYLSNVSHWLIVTSWDAMFVQTDKCFQTKRLIPPTLSVTQVEN